MTQEYERQRFKKIKAAIYAYLGNGCARCGFSDWRALQIDHKDGSGAAERGRRASSATYLLRILRSLTAGENRFQLLCANCNWIKRYERGEGHKVVPVTAGDT